MSIYPLKYVEGVESAGQKIDRNGSLRGVGVRYLICCERASRDKLFREVLYADSASSSNDKFEGSKRSSRAQHA